MYERHGSSNTRLYKIWCGMRDRCYRPSHDSFPYYGGRGISVCAEWNGSFMAFESWAKASGYRSDKSIDRIDGDKNYEPLNCRWSTDKQQARNKGEAKSHLTVDFDGRRLNLTEWSAATGIGYTTLMQRYKKGLRGAELLRATPYRRNELAKEAVREVKNGNAKLTQAVVDEVLSSKLSGLALAKMYKVSPALISMIRTGKRRAAPTA